MSSRHSFSQQAADPIFQRNDILSINTQQLSSTPFDSNLLSPYERPRANSHSRSPAYNWDDAGSVSDYSNYQASEYSDLVDDPYLGVDFNQGDADLSTFQDIDFTPSDAAQDSPSPTSEYPISPKQFSTSERQSLISLADEAKSITRHEFAPQLDFKSDYPISISVQVPDSALTPDHSGSDYSSAEGFELGTMASPHVTVSHWADEPPRNQFPRMHDFQQASQVLFQYPSQNITSKPLPSIPRDEEGLWMADDGSGLAGLDPQSRSLLSNQEIPSLKQQDDQIRINLRNTEVQAWRARSQGLVNANEQRPDSLWSEDNNVVPVDDAASIRNNKLLDDHTYYNLKNAPATEDDFKLMSQPLQFTDPPTLPYTTETAFQPPTANDAIQKFNGSADTISIISRSATWGTRRRSEPSLQDIEAVADGSFLKKLTINKMRDGQKNNNFFEQGLDRMASMVRKRSNGESHSALKRARSSQNLDQAAERSPQQTGGANLALPSRTLSFNRKHQPSLNTAFAAITGPLVAPVATNHARNGSLSAMAVSPKSPLRQGFSSMMKRARSRSDLNRPRDPSPSHGNLAGLWRGHGGPPVPTLAPPSADVDVKSNHQDLDDDDDDDDECDENDMRADVIQEPIIPTYEGFKAHVRRLNPDMDPQYGWLVSRIAHQQEIRYKNLLDMRIKHLQSTRNGSCSSGARCIALGGSAVLFDAKGKPREDPKSASGLQIVTDFSDDSNLAEGALSSGTFPKGVPLPPTRSLPAEFECQLCFKSKKFHKPSDWTKHVHEDVQPFTCTYDKCKEPKSFKRKADWVRHENERHRHLEWWICEMDDCRHPCYRKDNFLQHLVREHKLPEPKQKTKAAIKKARNTEAAWVMLEQCHHETPNKPQDEPCKFCGKTFVSWKKLTVHLAKHMEHISLPILTLVEQKNVDADTIISPVEQNLTPVTPASQGRFENGIPYHLAQPAPIIPRFQTGLTQPMFFTTSASSYDLPGQVTPDSYDHNSLFPDAYTVNSMHQLPTRSYSNPGQNTRDFGSLDSGYHSQPALAQHQQPHPSVFDVDPSTGYQPPFMAAPEFRMGAVNQYVTSSPVGQGFANQHISVDGQVFFDGLPQVQQQASAYQVPMGRAASYHGGENLGGYYT